MKLEKFEDHLKEQLRDPEFAAAFLETSLDDGIDEFLYALREVASAQDGGLTGIAEKTKLGRESMYKSLSRNGNPRIKTLECILDAVGLRISITRNELNTTNIMGNVD